MVQKKLPLINSAHGSETRNIINEVINAINDRGLEILSESSFLTWLDENGIKHREEVATVADLPSSDSLNTVRGVYEDNKIYIKKKNGWLPFQSIDISKINAVEEMAINRIEELAITPMKFGAIGDGIADDTSALQQANDYATDNNLLLDLVDKTYKITNTVTFDCNLDGKRASIIAENLGDKAALLIGTRGITDIKDRVIYTPHVKNSVKNWETGVGVEVANIVQSVIQLKTATQFEIGYLFTGYNRGLAYNKITLLHGNDNKMNFVISPKTGGWVNENTFYVQRLSHLSNNGNNVPGTKQIFITAEGDHPPNNNVIIKPSIEGNTAEYVIDIDYGMYNMFISPRFEGDNRKVRFGEQSNAKFSHSNVILYGYQTERIIVEETENAIQNKIYDRTGIKNPGEIRNANRGGAESGVFTTFPAQKSPIKANDNEYVVKTTQYGDRYKLTGDEFDRLRANTSGVLEFGSGDKAPDIQLRKWGTSFRVTGGNLQSGTTGAWNSEHLVLGTYHIWVDGTGNLRIKNGAPASDVDGRKLIME